MRAWVIEEDEAWREYMMLLLTGLNHQVRVIGSEHEALRALDEPLPEVILLSSDLSEREAALNVLSSITGTRDPKRTRVIFYGGEDEKSILAEAHQLKADAVFIRTELTRPNIADEIRLLRFM